MALGDRIKAIRGSLGWTQDKLAKEAGISKSFLSEIENGKANVSGENLLKIANALNASLDYLMKGDTAGAAERPKHVEIPAELSDVSEVLSLSYKTTLDLLYAHQSLVARRSTKERPVMTKEKWREFYRQLKDFLE